MFDDLNKGQNAPAAPGPAAIPAAPQPNPAAPFQPGNNAVSGKTPAQDVEDIFNETEKMEKPAVFAPKDPNAPDQGVLDPENLIPSRVPWKLIVGIVVLAGIALIGYGGYWGYNWWKGRSTVQIAVPLDGGTADTDTATSESKPSQPAEIDGNTPTNDKNSGQAAVTDLPQQADSTDSDQDGLADKEETEAGTDANNPDSDNDGLSDRQELKVYATNPLKPDSDGDGFTDGNEVNGGYDPKGPGKLYDIKK